MNELIATEADLKAQIDELRREWDRLDNHGSQTAIQAQIERRLEKLQQHLKDLSGEDY